MEKQPLNEMAVESRLERVAESITHGIWDWNLASNDIYVSPQYKRLLGFEDDELRMNDRVWEEMLHPDDRPFVLATLEKHVKSEERYDVDCRIRCKDGSYRWFRISGRASHGRTGQDSFLSGIMSDVTRFKNIELDLTRANEELMSHREALDQSAIVAETDPQGRITYVNGKFVEISKYSKYELLGKTHRLVNSGHHPPSFFTKMWKEISQGRIWRGEICNRAKDGRIYWVDTFIYPKRDSADRIEKYIAIRFDITKRMEAEAKLREEQMKLVQAARLASVGEMAAGIAHEINNPLTVIKGRMRAFQNRLQEDSIDKGQLMQLTEKVDVTVNRIAAIIKGLRTFARDGSGDEPVWVPVKALLEETFDFCKRRIEASEIRLEALVHDPQLEIRCRSVQISQVLLNLMQNARDAVVKLDEKWIRLEVLRDGEFVVITVTDSGTGIAIPRRERIFEPFFTTKEVGKGTGLGLSLSRNIVEGHRGTLELDHAHVNTRFVVRLPVDPF